jgi:hypothetical protein
MPSQRLEKGGGSQHPVANVSHTEYTECQAFYALFPNCDPHPLHPQESVAPLLWVQGGDTLACGGGGGGTDTLVPLVYYNPSTVSQLHD